MKSTKNLSGIELRLLLQSNCNFDCYFCLNEYYSSKNPQKTLTPDDYGLISKLSFCDYNINKITLTGGEPTLRRDLYSIISSVKLPTNHVTLVTNGVLLHKHIHALNMIDELHVSFHSFNEKDWSRITNSKGINLNLVRANIETIRSQYPNLRIKLNVVSEKANNSNEEIEKYIQFARKEKLEISLFRDTVKRYNFQTNKRNQENNSYRVQEWWDLSNYDYEFVKKDSRKQTYMVQGVLVHFSSTSNYINSWDSIWISPLGEAYTDVDEKSPVIYMGEMLKSKEILLLRKAFDSLLDGAILKQSVL